MEADPAPDLPGEFIDMQTIYQAQYGNREANTAAHISTPWDYPEQGLPPGGGPHLSGECGKSPRQTPLPCGPAPWGIYRETWPVATVVHNMEHAGVVVWYNTADADVIAELEALVGERLSNEDLVVLMPYPDLPAETIALSSWGRRDVFAVAEYNADRINAYLDAHVRRFNPEGL
jgi:hypothetical protein